MSAAKAKISEESAEKRGSEFSRSLKQYLEAQDKFSAKVKRICEG